MNYKLFGICCMLFLLSATSTYAQLNIGYMNTKDVLSKMPGRSKVEQQLQDYTNQKKEALQAKTAAFQDSVASYQQAQSTMSQQESKQKEKVLAQMQASLNKIEQTLRQQIQQKRADLLNPLYDKIDAAIAKVAEQKNLDFVINKSTNTGENIVFYAADKKLDVTDQVLNQIKNK